MVGVLVAALVSLQVAYFGFSRKLIVDGNDRTQREGMERLREAKEFSEWSKKDRESRLPPLTDEQREQMRQYLLIVQSHGLKMALADASDNKTDCPGCPVLDQARRQVSDDLSRLPTEKVSAKK